MSFKSGLSNIQDNKKEIYNQGRDQIKRNIPNLQGSKIDPKRQISSYEKEEIWNESETEIEFNPYIFRKDILGNVAIKTLSYNNASKEQLKFAYEYEHIVSHSDNGKTDKVNIRILNAQINRSKGSKPLYDMNYYESQGRKNIQCCSFQNLLNELEDNLHTACMKYNLLFVKKCNREWSIETGCNSKNNYKSYNNEYKKICEPKIISMKVDVNREKIMTPEALACGAVIFVGMSHVIGTGECIAVDNTISFVEKKLEIKTKKPETKWYEAAFVKEIVGAITIIGSVLLAAVLLEEPKKRKN